MRVYRQEYSHKGKKKRLAKWYISFRDHHGILHRMAGFLDKGATVDLGCKVKALVTCRTTGQPLSPELSRWVELSVPEIRNRLISFDILTGAGATASRALSEHIADFQDSLETMGNTTKRVNLVCGRVRKIARECGFRYWSDIQGEKVAGYLKDLRAGGTSAQTSNDYIQNFKQFCNWMVKTRRATDSPVAYLGRLNVKLDRRHERRALSVDELRRVLTAARHSDRIAWGMTGRDREMLYLTAMETGLRWNELRSLTRASFQFECEHPTVTVLPCDSKHKKEDVLPLGRETVSALKEYLAIALPTAPAFPMPKSDKGAAMLRVDLEAAGIEYVDPTGRFADFHALRHSFGTLLAQTGVHPKTAQDLMRHSDINLTMTRYTHTVLENQTAALDALPRLSLPAKEESEATGTDDEIFDARFDAFQVESGGTDRNKMVHNQGQNVTISPHESRKENAGNPLVSGGYEMSQLGESNPRPALYESAALPLS